MELEQLVPKKKKKKIKKKKTEGEEGPEEGEAAPAEETASPSAAAEEAAGEEGAEGEQAGEAPSTGDQASSGQTRLATIASEQERIGTLPDSVLKNDQLAKLRDEAETLSGQVAIPGTAKGVRSAPIPVPEPEEEAIPEDPQVNGHAFRCLMTTVARSTLASRTHGCCLIFIVVSVSFSSGRWSRSASWRRSWRI